MPIKGVAMHISVAANNQVFLVFERRDRRAFGKECAVLDQTAGSRASNHAGHRTVSYSTKCDERTLLVNTLHCLKSCDVGALELSKVLGFERERERLRGEARPVTEDISRIWTVWRA